MKRALTLYSKGPLMKKLGLYYSLKFGVRQGSSGGGSLYVSTDEGCGHRGVTEESLLTAHTAKR